MSGDAMGSDPKGSDEMGDDPMGDAAMRNLRGLIVLFAHPMAELYGSDRVLLESVRSVLDAGGRAVVVLPEAGPLAEVLVDAGASVRFCPTPVLRKTSLRPRGLLNLAAELLPDLRAARTIIRSVRPDVVYVNTVTIPLWIAAARSLRVPVLNHIHEAEASVPKPIALALNLPLLFCSRLIANSRFSVGVLAKTFPRLATRTTVVLNGVAGPQLPPLARENLGGGLRVVYVGRLSERKGPLVAVDALGLLSARGVAATLDLVGGAIPGRHDYENALHEHVHAAGITDRVWFYGFDADIWHHLERADVVVVPSLYNEPFGNTAVEALLAARPVIVSDTSGLREATEGYRSALRVTPGDPGALADALEALIPVWPVARMDACSDRRLASQRHSPEAYRRTIAGVLFELATPARHAAARHPHLATVSAAAQPVTPEVTAAGHPHTAAAAAAHVAKPTHVESPTAAHSRVERSTTQGSPPWTHTTT
ncbi:glycosyltransferase [Subtercola lobariae]|uniref:Glycosyl transferase n=1 Tax=Subtercola lobariae TaxID=1588641 RepID=A0A917B2K4_9MICO|nr:glycosyltransferase [Subtercola lobariae]GGF13895.1 glycosyl transferase [Subtercola lobariae]